MQIELSDKTFARLQAKARPFVDFTPESVICALLDALRIEESGTEAIVANGTSGTLPDLTHTKPLLFSFGGKPLSKPNWNGLLVQAIHAACKSAKSDNELKSLLHVPYMTGIKRDEGFRPLVDLGISYQGQDANSAWRAVRHIANRLGIKVEVTFVWREKEGAAYPGEQRTLTAGLG